MTYHILVVDNEPTDLEVTKMILSEDSEFIITAVTDPEQALALVRQDRHGFSLALLDYHMPVDGLTLAEQMFKVNPKLQIAMLSADQSRDVLKKSISLGISNFIDKDEDSKAILGIVRSLCQKWKDQHGEVSETISTEKEIENIKWINSFGLIGRSEKLADVCHMIDRASKSNCNVLIRGESGSGKELIARAIHEKSERHKEPFVAINVAAINPNLAESELFGHVKGAFTGAISNSVGKILSAQGGTLFLDEIGDLKLDLQVKLLRVLQEKKLQPVGSNKTINFDVRIITATHVNLEQAIQNGKFREDLYYRLNVFPIFNPSLRERSEDIKPLVKHFIQLHNIGQKKLLAKTLKAMESYSWPGNIRELENEVQRLLTFDGNSVEFKNLKEAIKDVSLVSNSYVDQLTHFNFQKRLWKMELDYLEHNISKEGSIREACKSVFHAPSSTIHSRIHKLRENLSKVSKIKEGEL